MKPAIALGVDLGTTWTAASIQSDGATPAPLPLARHGLSMPSVVAVVEGDIVTGDRAVRAAVDDPAAAAREFKRRLGDTTPIVLGGTPYGAETLMGHLLAAVLGAASTAGLRVGEVILTHPAVWGEYKLDLLREASRVAGVAQVSLRSEPEAAALHYAQLGRLRAGECVAVYDFGGGTFDAAIVRIGESGAELLGNPEGLERLGGIDVDHAMVALVNEACGGAIAELDTSRDEVRRAVAALRVECTNAKEALSADTETAVRVSLPGMDTVVRVTRVELEAVLRPRLAETLGALDRAIASASLSTSDLTGIVMVGGSSRIPLIAETIASHTGRPLLVDADPKFAVVHGAAAGRAGATAPTHKSAQEQELLMATKEPTTPTSPGAGASPEGGAVPKAGTAATGGPPSQRRTQPGSRPPESSGTSRVGVAAAGVAATAAAGAAVFIWRDDLMDAIFGGDTAEAADAPPAETVDESMDAFEAPPSGGGGGGGGGGVGGGASGGGGFRAAPTAPQPNVAAPTPATAPSEPQVDPEYAQLRLQLSSRLENWQPPEGADPAEAAALRERLAGVLERYEPRSGQTAEQAMADLREQFELRIEAFANEARVDALVEAEQRREAVEAAEETPLLADDTTDDESSDTTDADDTTDDATDGPLTGIVGMRDQLVDDWDELVAERKTAIADPGDDEVPPSADAEPSANEEAPAEAAAAAAEPEVLPDDDALDPLGRLGVEQAVAAADVQFMTAPGPDDRVTTTADDLAGATDVDLLATPEPEPTPEETAPIEEMDLLEEDVLVDDGQGDVWPETEPENDHDDIIDPVDPT